MNQDREVGILLLELRGLSLHDFHGCCPVVGNEFGHSALQDGCLIILVDMHRVEDIDPVCLETLFPEHDVRPPKTIHDWDLDVLDSFLLSLVANLEAIHFDLAS